MPVADASGERVFPKLKTIKNYLHSAMEQDKIE